MALRQKKLCGTSTMSPWVLKLNVLGGIAGENMAGHRKASPSCRAEGERALIGKNH